MWFDVRLWMLASERVRGTLAEVDPAHASIDRTNARRYLRELAALDRYVRSHAAEEARVEHLAEHLRWEPEFAAKVVRQAERRGVVSRHDANLELTEPGRRLAREAIVA